jgi:hypothetical protein
MAEVSWRNGVVGNWFSADNWIGDTVPVTGDAALVTSGTAIISATQDPTIAGLAIVLGGDGLPVTLHAFNTKFEGAGSGPQEVNTTLTVNGTLTERTNAVFITGGNTSFDGQIFVEALAGSLTIDVRDDGANAGVFRLLNSDQKAAVVVSQESFLDFEGLTVFNTSLIQIEGAVEISAGVTFTGSDGVFLLENGGQLLVEGTVDATQQIIFIDGTGQLVIENIAGFDGVVEYAELPTPAGQPHQGIAGGRIQLTDVQAQSLIYVPGTGTEPGTLKLHAGLNQSGAVVAELKMGLVSDSLEKSDSFLASEDFALSSDGSGGTVITYAPQGATYLLSSLPTPVIAEAGDMISLKSILKDAFGQSNIPFKGVWLLPSQPFENTATNVGYWDSPNVTPQWFIGKNAVEEATFVKDIGKVKLQAGNQIIDPASFQLRLTKDKNGPDAAFMTYDVWTVDPRIMQTTGFAPGTAPTPDMVVATAEAFATVYGNGVIPNTNLCNWIADNVAAGAGAPMPLPNTSFDPSLNVEGGFWRIAYASDVPDPVEDWYPLVEAGDIIRMGWFKPESGRVSGHSTTALSEVGPEGDIKFYDNVDDGHIGTHFIEYWPHTDPDDITIYRLDPNQQYLIQGTQLAEVIYGTVYNDLIRPGGGADTIIAKLGDNEIEGSAAQLDGIKVKHFNLGDSFHFTDLDPDLTSVRFRSGKLEVFDDVEKVAVIKVQKPGGGLSFAVSPDQDGGVLVELAAHGSLARASGVAADQMPGFSDWLL